MEIGDARQLKSDINVTPLVDVMLVLLIIFMIVTPMLQQGVSVSLPKAVNVAAVADNADQVVVVTLRQNGDLYLANESIDHGTLVQRLRIRHNTNAAVQLQIKADANARFADVRKLIRAGREAGFDAAALIASELRGDATPPQQGTPEVSP